jgi:hypothetical protein
MSRQILVTVTVGERTIEIYRFADTSGPKHGWFEALVKPPPVGLQSRSGKSWNWNRF